MRAPEPLALGAFLLTFLFAVLLGPPVIGWLRVLKFGQNINEYAPAGHQQKQGTPTMGGVLLVVSLLLSVAVGLLAVPSLRPVAPSTVAVLLVFVGHAALGFTDDLLKARRGKSLGLLARQKLAGQVLIGLLFVGWLALTAEPGVTTHVGLARFGYFNLGTVYYPLALVLMIGLSNAANLTDGLDGLAGGLSLFTLLGLSLTSSLLFPQLPLVGFALAGACLGFLWFNAHPARVFMGDTGSLALGSSFAAIALIGKQEILVLLFALVFLIETLSVMIQVSVFKATGGKPNGRRVFKMTPIHHHFELSGWAETQVVARFWIVGVLALIAGLLIAGVL